MQLAIRKAVALAALTAMGAMLATGLASAPAPVYDGGALRSPWLLLLPVMAALAGLLAGRAWGRWLGLAIAVAVLPWATVLTFTAGMPAVRFATSLAACLALLASLIGRVMFERYEGRMKTTDWRGPRMPLLRWTLICNLAAVLTLLLFVVAYRFRFEWHFAAFASLLAGLLGGVVLLARQKTAGLLLLWLCCILMLPAGAWFLGREAANLADAILFVVAFLPGIVTSWATVFVFGRPVLRFLRSA